MAEQAQKLVQSSIKNFVNEVDAKYLRNMERVMYECAAKCCANNTGTIDEVHECVEKCQVTVNTSRSIV